jgi:hypothetical protein
VPEDIATEVFRMLYLMPDEEEAYQEAQAILLGDLRFEYMERRQVEAVLWRFLCESYTDRARDHVQRFIAEHAWEIRELTCYLPVEYLTVDSDVEVTGVRLLPTTNAEIPRKTRWFVLEPPVGCIAAVSVSGTNYARMAARGRSRAEHALRVLRITLRASPGIDNDQLRFALGEAYAFDDGASGWSRRGGMPCELTLTTSAVEAVRAQPTAALRPAPSNSGVASCIRATPTGCTRRCDQRLSTAASRLR